MYVRQSGHSVVTQAILGSVQLIQSGSDVSYTGRWRATSDTGAPTAGWWCTDYRPLSAATSDTGAPAAGWWCTLYSPTRRVMPAYDGIWRDSETRLTACVLCQCTITPMILSGLRATPLPLYGTTLTSYLIRWCDSEAKTTFCNWVWRVADLLWGQLPV